MQLSWYSGRVACVESPGLHPQPCKKADIMERSAPPSTCEVGAGGNQGIHWLRSKLEARPGCIETLLKNRGFDWRGG